MSSSEVKFWNRLCYDLSHRHFSDRADVTAAKIKRSVSSGLFSVMISSLTLFIPCIVTKYETYVTPTNAMVSNLCMLSFTWLLHVSVLLSHHVQGADTKIYLKLTAIKYIYAHCDQIQFVIDSMSSEGKASHLIRRDIILPHYKVS
jgi:hypothetical protein